MLEVLLSKEVAAAVLGSLVLLGGGYWLYVHNEKKRQRIEIFTRLAAIPSWVADPKTSSELLSAIPTAFAGRFHDRVRIAYRNYQGSLNPYPTVVWVREPGQQDWRKLEIALFSDQTVFRRDLLRELAIASGWMSQRRAADFDFTSLAISLVPQGQLPPGPGQPSVAQPPPQIQPVTAQPARPTQLQPAQVQPAQPVQPTQPAPGDGTAQP